MDMIDSRDEQFKVHDFMQRIKAQYFTMSSED